jgi:hypothetical protein
MRGTRIFCALALGAAALIGPGHGAAASDKQPPSCAAVTFRPVPSGTSDGEQDAGLYKSRFGRIEVKASVRNGQAVNYYVAVNGQAPPPVPGAVPKSIESCAKAKRLGAAGAPPKACIGDRLAVLIGHSNDQRYVLLYAHRNGEWRFCSAGTA